MRVLLLGGTGEVGHHIANGLSERGHEVTVLTRGRNSRGFTIDMRIPGVQADKNDAAALEQAVAGLHPEVVIDTVPGETSVRNVHNLFSGRIAHYIHCSSTGVYAPLRYIPGDEQHADEPAPGDFYVPVAARDRLAFDLGRRGGYGVTVLRPTMIIGRGVLPVDNLGGRSPQFLRDLAANRPLELPEDGDVLVQGGFNADLAQAFILAAERPGQAAGEVFNISCSKAVTLRHYLELCKEALGSTSELVPTSTADILARHAGDGRVDEYWFRFLLQHMCFDISKARARLGYNPPHELRDSVRLVVEWARDTGKF